jgi:hypothetical protein
MDIGQDLIQRAQILLTLEHPLVQVKDILLQEGYPPDQVQELIEATEAALGYMAPLPFDGNNFGIDIIRAEEPEDIRKPSLDIIVNKKTGKLSLITPQYQETWRVANEVRKAITKYREGCDAYLY